MYKRIVIQDTGLINFNHNWIKATGREEASSANYGLYVATLTVTRMILNENTWLNSELQLNQLEKSTISSDTHLAHLTYQSQLLKSNFQYFTPRRCSKSLYERKVL